MTTEENKAIARRMQEEFWSHRNHAVADELLGPTYVDDQPEASPDITPSSQGYKPLVFHHFTAFPDHHVTIEMQIAEGDYAVTR